MITVAQLRLMIAALPDDALLDVKFSRIDSVKAPTVASSNAERCKRYRAKHVATMSKHVATMSSDMPPMSQAAEPTSLSGSSGSSFSSSPELNSEPLSPAFSSSPDLTQASQVSTQAGETATVPARDMGGDMHVDPCRDMHVALPPEPLALALVPSGPKTKQPKTPKPAKTYRCPETWQPKDCHWQIATERGIDLRAELENFRDYEFKTARSDWDAVFRRWLRNATPPRAQTGRFAGAMTAEDLLARHQRVVAEEAAGIPQAPNPFTAIFATINNSKKLPGAAE